MGFLVIPVKINGIVYEVTPEYVEYNRITVKNTHNRSMLFRVDVNHQLSKLLYIEPNSSKSFVRKGKITNLYIKELK